MREKFKFVLALLCAVVCFDTVFAGVSVQNIGGGVLECSVDNAVLEIKRVGAFDIVSSPGCAESFRTGEAALPVRNFFISLGGISSVSSFEIVSVERVVLSGVYNVRAVGLPRPMSAGPAKSPSSAAAVSSSGGEVLRLNSVQERGADHFASFSLKAAEYDSSGKLTHIKKVVFRIKLEGDVQGAAIPSTAADRRLVSSFAASPARTFSAMPSAPEGYLLITKDALMSSFQGLLDSHAVNFSTFSITIADIESSYAGLNTQAKIKACIKDFHDNSNVRYVLLGGDTDIIPAKGVYAKVSGSALERKALADYEDSNIPCDLYYADTSTATWDNDGDGVFGEWTDGVNFMPGVYIGRAPVSTAEEAENFVSKALYYPLRNNFRELLIAGWLISGSLDGKDLMTGAGKVKAQTPDDFDIEEMYASDGTLSASAAIDEINEGIDFLNHSGHGLSDSLDPVFNNSNVSSLSNTKPFVVASIGCLAGAFDSNDCIGEFFVKGSGGASAFIGNARFGWFDEVDATKFSGEFMVAFYGALFNSDMNRMGEAFAKSKIDFIAQASDLGDPYNPYRWIEYSLNLFGDPAMVLPSEKQLDFVSYDLPSSTASEVIPGTVNNLVFELKNIKSTDTLNVSAVISTDDPYVTILSSYAYYGDIGPSASSSNVSSPFKFSVSELCPCEHIINFDLLMNTTDCTFYRQVSVAVSRTAPGLTMVYCWPNPVRSGTLHISNIPLNSRPAVSIYNIAGEEVAFLHEGEGISALNSSMRADWDLKNKYGKPAASGVYYYFLRSSAGSGKGKVAVIK
ncbi:MAG: C25 family cysteine peptidase [Elusimicrobiota bacterium]|nr:C25 family cysteine peptidase [Elusimicrobiota bacterium]